MVTEFRPRSSRYLNDDRDWYDHMLHQMREQLCAPVSCPFASTPAERKAAGYIGEQAITLFIFQLEPALADLDATPARREAERLTQRLLSGTHPDDLDHEAYRYYGGPETRTTWGLTVKEALRETDIDQGMAYRYRLDTAQANRLRQHMGLPCAPYHDTVWGEL